MSKSSGGRVGRTGKDARGLSYLQDDSGPTLLPRVASTHFRGNTWGHAHAPGYVVHRIHRGAHGGASVARGDRLGCVTRGLVHAVFSEAESIPLPGQPTPRFRRQAD